MAKIKNVIMLALAAVLVQSCSQNSNTLTEAYASLESKSDTQVEGEAHFMQEDDMVTMSVTIKNATPGLHGIHIHEKGDCSAHDGSSAGGHWNPTNDKHGEWGTESHHYGDIGNIKVDSSGNGKLNLVTDKWNLKGDDKFSIIGKSIVVHSGQDDLVSQPSGHAGYKVACGVIKRGK